MTAVVASIALAHCIGMACTFLALAEPYKTSDTVRYASLAKVAPSMCPELKTDDKAVSQYLSHAGVTQRDLSGRYKPDAQAAADDFRQGAAFQPAQVCSDVWDRLGSEGLRLLTTKDDD